MNVAERIDRELSRLTVQAERVLDYSYNHPDLFGAEEKLRAEKAAYRILQVLHVQGRN